MDEIPNIEKQDDKTQPIKDANTNNDIQETQVQHKPNLKTADIIEEEQEDNDYNDENATTTWSLGLILNIILNGILWFCVVLSMF